MSMRKADDPSHGFGDTMRIGGLGESTGPWPTPSVPISVRHFASLQLE